MTRLGEPPVYTVRVQLTSSSCTPGCLSSLRTLPAVIRFNWHSNQTYRHLVLFTVAVLASLAFISDTIFTASIQFKLETKAMNDRQKRRGVNLSHSNLPIKKNTNNQKSIEIPLQLLNFSMNFFFYFYYQKHFFN